MRLLEERFSVLKTLIQKKTSIFINNSQLRICPLKYQEIVGSGSAVTMHLITASRSSRTLCTTGVSTNEIGSGKTPKKKNEKIPCNVKL